MAARRVKDASSLFTFTPESLAVFGSIAIAKRDEYLEIDNIKTKIKAILVFTISLSVY